MLKKITKIAMFMGMVFASASFSSVDEGSIQASHRHVKLSQQVAPQFASYSDCVHSTMGVNSGVDAQYAQNICRSLFPDMN